MRRKSSNNQYPRISCFRGFYGLVCYEPSQRMHLPTDYTCILQEHILLFFTENLGFSVIFRFFVYFRFFRNNFFRLFRFYTETESFDVSIEPKQTEDPPKQFKREYNFGIFQKIQGCFGLFRFLTKQFCLFRLFRYRFETTKQTENFCYWFHETNRNKRETDLVSVCFGSNRNLFLFVSRTPQQRDLSNFTKSRSRTR